MAVCAAVEESRTRRATAHPYPIMALSLPVVLTGLESERRIDLVHIRPGKPIETRS